MQVASAESAAAVLTDRSDLADHGVFSLTDGRLAFSIVGPSGAVDYHGTLNAGGNLELTWHSHINGHDGIGIYAFEYIEKLLDAAFLI
jgi:hypothetical protein